MADAIAQIAEFFRRLHGEEAFGHLIVWTRQDKATRAFDLGVEGALAAAAEYSRQRAETCDVYAAVGLQRSPPAGSGRGAEDGVCSVPAVWADVDIAGPAHSSKELPPTVANTIWDSPPPVSGTRSRLITLPARATYFIFV